MKAYLTILLLACLSFSLTPFAQTEYVFKDPSLVSGTALQTGAVYKYPGVYPNTDALVTITNMTNGITLSSLDANASGYDNAFQPVVNFPASQKSFVEFRVNFVESSNNSIAKEMTEVPVTGLDIDGHAFTDNNIYEFNQFKTTSSYYVNYNMTGGDLNVALNTGWYEAANRSARVYKGVDTSARGVMFSMVSDKVTSVSFRVGTDNRSATIGKRQSSIYFRKFSFTNMLLPAPLIIHFGGVISETSGITLNWTLASVETLSKIVIEKGIGPNDFLPIGEISAFSNKSKVSFSFTDDNPGSERIHYRLVFYQPDEMTYYSKILYFEITPDPEKSWFTAFPTIVRNGMTARVRAEKEGTGTIRIINYSGKVVYTQVVELRMGNNTILVDDPNKMPAGYYIAVMENGGKKATQKILKL